MTRAEPAPGTRVRRTGGGFTMIEVVAAVVILGIWFTLLVTIVSDGLAHEATTRIRLEASLVADEALADAEAALLAGGAVTLIALGDEHPYGNYAGTPFDVVVTSAPFDPLGSLQPREGAAVAPQGLSIDVSKLPPLQQAAALEALLEIRVEVYRAESELDPFEAADEEAPALASRTTYVLDSSVLSSLTLPGAKGGDGGGGASDRPLGSGGGGR